MAQTNSLCWLIRTLSNFDRIFDRSHLDDPCRHRAQASADAADHTRQNRSGRAVERVPDGNALHDVIDDARDHIRCEGAGWEPFPAAVKGAVQAGQIIADVAAQWAEQYRPPEELLRERVVMAVQVARSALCDSPNADA